MAPDPENAETWLKRLENQAKQARIEMEGLSKITEATRRSQMAILDLEEQDALDAIDKSSMSEADKIRARQEAKSTAERARLESRGQGREQRANESRAGVTAAEQDAAEKEAIMLAQIQRATVWKDIRDFADRTSARDGSVARQQFDQVAKSRGLDMRYDKDEQALADAAKNEKEAAEQRLKEAQERDRRNREAIAAEQATDERVTQRRIQRAEQDANDRANKLEETKPDEVPESPEYDRSGEDAARQGLLDAAQNTGSANAKARYEELARSLNDNNTTAAEKQQLEQLITRLEQMGGDGNTRLAGLLQRALATIDQKQQTQAQALAALEQQVEGMRSNGAAR